MKRMTSLVSFLLVTLLVVGMASPLALASSEAGTGQSRVVTLNNPYEYTNATVTVPEVLNNETANSFEFNVTDESGSPDDFAFYILINGSNYGVVNITSVGDDTAFGWVNYTADEIPILNDANITISMRFKTNWTEADVWWGTFDVVDANTYTIRITTTDVIYSVMAMGIVLLMVAKVLSSMNQTTDRKKK